uniref:RNA helicase n=1 Tax=Strongyloides papillosus TaxID=174720 RepID=A0A0N5BD40_STREA
MFTFIKNLNLRQNVQKLNGDDFNYVQSETFNDIKQGKSMYIRTGNGQGKTAAYLTPLLDYFIDLAKSSNSRHKMLVICPTRELAEQVYQTSTNLLFQVDGGVTVSRIYAGIRKIISIDKVPPNSTVLIATPGQLLKMLMRAEISLMSLETVVVEEADRMFEDDFYEDLKMLNSFIPQFYRIQKLIVSSNSTMNLEQRKTEYLGPNYVEKVWENHSPISNNISNIMLPTPTHNTKLSALLGVLHGSQYKLKKTIIFVRKKETSVELSMFLTLNGIENECLNGDLEQYERSEIMKKLSLQNFTIISTDIASRGLNLPQVDQLIHYDLPVSQQLYCCRMGRLINMGKMGTTNQLISFNFYQESTDFHLRDYLDEILKDRYFGTF